MDKTGFLGIIPPTWEMFYFIVGGLSVAITALAFYIKHLHKQYSASQTSNLVKITEAMIKTGASIDSNTEVNREVRQLMHTVNVNILELKSYKKRL